MIVGLNLLYLLPGVVGGTETYAAGLLQGLERAAGPERFVVFLNQESAGWRLPEDTRFRRVVCPVKAVSRAARYRFEQSRLPALARAEGVQVLHSLGYVAPLRAPCPSVVTVHDLHYLSYGRWRDWPRRRLLAWIVRQSVRRAAAVITVSRYMRRTIAGTYGVPEEAIDVVPEAALPRPAGGRRPGALTGGPYILAFGGVTPNKNLDRLLAAYERARERHDLSWRLVLVGRLPPSLRADRPGVVTTGYLSDADLAAVLGGAEALVFPSLYEGFGLPVLEAMAAGVPVVCSNATAVPEVAGDAAIYFDPQDVDDMAARLGQVAGDPELRWQLSARGAVRAAGFTWERAGRETLAVYHRVATPSDRLDASSQPHVAPRLDSRIAGGDL